MGVVVPLPNARTPWLIINGGWSDHHLRPSREIPWENRPNDLGVGIKVAICLEFLKIRNKQKTQNYEHKKLIVFERNTLLATKKSQKFGVSSVKFSDLKAAFSNKSWRHWSICGGFFPATKNPSRSWPSVDPPSRFELFTTGLPRPRGRGSQQELGEYQRRFATGGPDHLWYLVVEQGRWEWSRYVFPPDSDSYRGSYFQ